MITDTMPGELREAIQDKEHFGNFLDMQRIGWSTFAYNRNYNSNSNSGSRFLGHPDQLRELIHANWKDRVPGVGRSNLDEVVVVPISGTERELASLFSCGWIPIEQASNFQVEVKRRTQKEDPYLSITADGPTLPVTSAQVVLYSHATLLENDGEASGLYEWEIVAIIAGPWKEEPMLPLTMARNYLSMPGGTYAPYNAHQFAQSIYHWAGYVMAR